MCVLSQMGQLFHHCIVFVSIAVQFTQMPKRPKIKKITPTANQKRKKLHEKILEKSGAAVKKCLNEESCSCIFIVRKYMYL